MSDSDTPQTHTPSPTLLDGLVLAVKRAGAPSEDSYDFDGAFSYHAETHAAGMGIAAGWMATAHGEADLFGLVYGAAVYGKAQERNQQRRRILVDIRDEKHYALGGIVTGAILGSTLGRLTTIPGVEMTDLLDLSDLLRLAGGV